MKGFSAIAAGLFSAAALAMGLSAAHAQVPEARCIDAKLKCVGKKVDSLIKCHFKAEKKGEPVDPACIQTAIDKFQDPLKGCFPKAELNKPPCATTGDVGAQEAKADAFLLDLASELDGVFPVLCSAEKKKCAAKKLKALWKCYRKSVKKGEPLDPACIQTAVAKFQDPLKGCFPRTELKKQPCVTFDDAAAIEAKIDAYVQDVVAELGVTFPAMFDLSTTPGP